MALPKNSAYINVNGEQKNASAVWVNVNGTWKSATAVWVNVNGTWRKQKSTIVCTIYGARNETITYSGTSSGSIALNASGIGTKELPFGSHTFTGNITGRSTTITISDSTSVIYVRPQKIIYWYGVEEVAFGDIRGNDWDQTVTRNANSITVSVSRNSNGSAYRSFMTANSVSLAGYSSLKAILEGMAVNGWYQFGAVDSRATYSGGVVASNTPTITTMDVSSISGTRYIGVMGTSYARGDTATATIYAIWLE